MVISSYKEGEFHIKSIIDGDRAKRSSAFPVFRKQNPDYSCLFGRPPHRMRSSSISFLLMPRKLVCLHQNHQIV
ncbi:hypothetical protein C5167_035337 [Papaver somniferum]|uniref:Uncharacterized protein n=1 Tax=Papaver somniferum TaxID=3469 RepID=A0A4Y7KH21_PAPSO|nr:hypothetical protein C5167_035337 [Papaver somniferum]